MLLIDPNHNSNLASLIKILASGLFLISIINNIVIVIKFEQVPPSVLICVFRYSDVITSLITCSGTTTRYSCTRIKIGLLSSSILFSSIWPLAADLLVRFFFVSILVLSYSIYLSWLYLRILFKYDFNNKSISNSSKPSERACSLISSTLSKIARVLLLRSASIPRLISCFSRF